MASHTDTHGHVVHFNCLTVWSNSKWICDLSIDSFAPRLWIKCFNYWCTDVRCSLECCMWCRPLSPGKLLPHPTHNPTAPPPPPSLLHHTPSCSSQLMPVPGRQASTNTKINSASLYLPPLLWIYCNRSHQRLVCAMLSERCFSAEQLVLLVNCIYRGLDVCKCGVLSKMNLWWIL